MIFARRGSLSSPPSPRDAKDERIDQLEKVLGEIANWNEHTLGPSSAYLGSQLHAILTGQTIRFGFQFEKGENE